MKKLLLAAIFLFMGLTAFGQTYSIRTSILEYLQSEGYEAGIDEDDDFLFTSNDHTYQIYIEDKDEDGFHYIRLVSVFSTMDYDLSVIEILTGANTVHEGYKQVTVYCSEDEDHYNIYFETGCFVTTAAQYIKVIERHVSCIETGIDVFFGLGNDEEEEEEAIIMIDDLSDSPA